MTIRKSLLLITATTAAVALSGCIVAPARGYDGGGYRYGADGYYAPSGVVYVAPAFEAPGPGWGWRYHEENHAWGWYHPEHGWRHSR